MKLIGLTLSNEMMNAKNILVTGSAGHLGEALVRNLRKSIHSVVGVDLISSDFTDHVGSIADREFVAKCMDKIEVVLHAATLHKPHVATHSRQDFVDTNVTGTLNLLEESAASGVEAFVFTSTTSTFGDSMRPKSADTPAIWVTEELPPKPKNIYGVTKIAAEQLCQLFHRNHQLPCLILRTSRFFPEVDDRKEVRDAYPDPNIKTIEFLYRRVDIEDVVSAHLLAMEKAQSIGFGRYIISATTPFTPSDLDSLTGNAVEVVKRIEPAFESIFSERGWRMFPSVDRVYVNELARKELGWEPKHNFSSVLKRIQAGGSPLSQLAHEIGQKMYHDQVFDGEPYPVD